MIAAKAAIVPGHGHRKIEPIHQYLSTNGPRKTVINVLKGDIVFRQGDPADSVFYIQKGQIKITVTSPHGKEATLALQNKGDFFGLECISPSQSLHFATASALMPSTVLRIDSKEMMQALDADKLLAQFFQSFLLTRCLQMQTSLIDRIFNSCEKRLARTLLSLAQLKGSIEVSIPHPIQESLAEMIGTTRARASFFMNRFRKMGYIQYKGANSTVHVHHSLFNVLLQDSTGDIGDLCSSA